MKELMDTKALSTLLQKLTVECIVEVKRVIRLVKTTCEREIFFNRPAVRFESATRYRR